MRRARRASSLSPSNVIGARRTSAGSTPSNALTLTTAYSRPSMRLVTTGTMPHAEQIWNSAVLVPNAYFDTRVRSLTLTLSDPPGHDVHTPPCFVQNEHVHARAGISDGSGGQSRVNDMLPQWQPPTISMGSHGESIGRPQPRKRPRGVMLQRLSELDLRRYPRIHERRAAIGIDHLSGDPTGSLR